MPVLCNDLFYIISEYSYGIRMSHEELMEDIEKVDIVRECIHDVFLTVSCFDAFHERFVHNMYRSFSPYYPTKNISPKSIISTSILCIAQTLSPRFFERIRSYRSIFFRHCLRFQQGNLCCFNRILERYLIFIRESDLDPYLKKSRVFDLLKSFDHSVPLPSTF